MGRAVVILAGVLILALLAGSLTEVTLAVGHRNAAGDEIAVRPTKAKVSFTPRASALPSTVPVAATPTPSPVPTPSATPSGPIATTNSFVHMRAGKSIYTNILTDLDGGTVVSLLPDSDAQWQEVQYNGLTGYIFKSYLAY